MGGASTLTSVLNTSFYHLKFSLQKRKLFRLVLRRSLKKVQNVACRHVIQRTLVRLRVFVFPQKGDDVREGGSRWLLQLREGLHEGRVEHFYPGAFRLSCSTGWQGTQHQPRSGAGRLRAQPTGQSILRLLPVAGHMCSEGRPLRAFFWPFVGCSSQRNTFGCTVGLALGDVCAKMLQHQVSYKIEHFLFMTFPDLVVRLLLSSFLFSMLLFNYEWAKIAAWGLGVELRLRAWGYIMDGAEEIPSTHQWLYASRCKPYRTIFFGGGDEVQVGEFCQSVLDYVPFGI